jgi:signal transduction histidine kinase
MDGLSLGKSIKEINMDTEVIILTGKATLESAMKAVKENFYDYLTKPVDPKKLIEVINSALEKQRLVLENKRLLWELKKSNKELEKLNKFKDGLISMISHDLRSPISSLKGFNYALLEGYAGELTGGQKEIVITENDAIETMMELINNLLDMRQIEVGELKMKKEIVDMEKNVIQPVVKRLSPQINENKINIKVICEENLPEVKIDPVRISQVIQNLLQNAIKFTPQDGNIELALSRIKDDQIELRIKDTGSGIPEERLNTIFEVFYTEDNTNRDREKIGMGLGLAICKEVVRAHGGVIWAESDGIKKGSTFIVVLPINGKESN